MGLTRKLPPASERSEECAAFNQSSSVHRVRRERREFFEKAWGVSTWQRGPVGACPNAHLGMSCLCKLAPSMTRAHASCMSVLSCCVTFHPTTAILAAEYEQEAMFRQSTVHRSLKAWSVNDLVFEILYLDKFVFNLGNVLRADRSWSGDCFPFDRTFLPHLFPRGGDPFLCRESYCSFLIKSIGGAEKVE